MPSLTHFFWMNSDWAYLGADRLESLARHYELTVAHKPIDLLYVYSQSGGVPLHERSPQRQRYREAELARWTQALGIQLNITPKYMCPDATLASYLVIAADTAGYDVAALYKQLMAAEWCEDKDISEIVTLREVLANLNFDTDQLLPDMRQNRIEEQYARYTDEAIAAGAFGSPTYVLNGEVFWGQDRLKFVDKALSADTGKECLFKGAIM